MLFTTTLLLVLCLHSCHGDPKSVQSAGSSSSKEYMSSSEEAVLRDVEASSCDSSQESNMLLQTASAPKKSETSPPQAKARPIADSADSIPQTKGHRNGSEVVVQNVSGTPAAVVHSQRPAINVQKVSGSPQASVQFQSPAVNAQKVSGTPEAAIHFQTPAITGQAGGMLALAQGTSTLHAFAGSRAQGGEEAASIAGLLMLAVLIISLGLYVIAAIWDGGLKGDQRRTVRGDRYGETMMSGHGTQKGLPMRPAESLLHSWPPMTTPQMTPPPSHPNLASSKSIASRPKWSSMPATSQEDYERMPMIYPQLVMPNYTRLAVPVDPLLDPHFEFDILGLSGIPLLTAVAVSRNGRRSIEISLFNAGTNLVTVTPNLQLTRADGSLIGSIAKQGSEGSQYYPPSKGAAQQYVMRNSGGRTVLLISPGRTLQEMKFVTTPDHGVGAGGSIQGLRSEIASITRQPAGQLPAEHYEVVVWPNVDAVLILACFLALCVFALPPPSITPVAGYTRPQSSYDARASTMSAALSAAGGRQ
eukprot:TRINITY_DN50603_c0_g1_i1.p1 TRINITY_DN50603_c0_g1~~TRINITY_DN50603_c0_g1_i1.p1  ORF type:complete len:531 (+),score=87.49 TRINITY_DN50603_c0_g1_i1:212-1804(+)